jgi:hypothetical protein
MQAAVAKAAEAGALPTITRAIARNVLEARPVPGDRADLFKGLSKRAVSAMSVHELRDRKLRCQQAVLGVDKRPTKIELAALALLERVIRLRHGRPL